MERLQSHYYALNDYLREEFGEKIYKISLDGGMTCPNRDGKLGYNGCIFCSQGGSGEFAETSGQSITQRIESAINKLGEKMTGSKYIAYFQSYTNTYAPIEYLSRIFTEAIMHKDVVILAIATRPDCLPEEVLGILQQLNKIKPVWIELGLQTIHEESASYIRRGYDLRCFDEAVHKLKAIGIKIIVHLIIGLPFEGVKENIETIQYLNNSKINGVKLQLLHVLKGTDLALEYDSKVFTTLNFEEYRERLFTCIEHLDPDIVVHRITGDGPKSLLIAPTWSANKRVVLNTLTKEFQQRKIVQGKYFLRTI